MYLQTGAFAAIVTSKLSFSESTVAGRLAYESVLRPRSAGAVESARFRDQAINNVLKIIPFYVSTIDPPDK